MAFSKRFWNIRRPLHSLRKYREQPRPSPTSFRCHQRQHCGRELQCLSRRELDRELDRRPKFRLHQEEEHVWAPVFTVPGRSYLHVCFRLLAEAKRRVCRGWVVFIRVTWNRQFKLGNILHGHFCLGMKNRVLYNIVECPAILVFIASFCIGSDIIGSKCTGMVQGFILSDSVV